MSLFLHYHIDKSAIELLNVFSFVFRTLSFLFCIGLSFTLSANAFYKINSTGSELPADAAQWLCVEDKSSGLTWEVKQLSGLQNHQFVATWATTQTYINMINNAELCSFDDWRLPTANELKALSAHKGSNSLINPEYFPLANDHWFWTDSKISSLSNKAWVVRSKFGLLDTKDIQEKHHIRLVRD